MNGAGDSSGGEVVLGGRYRLISQIGVGGMAVVWQAYDDVLARTVAVKVLGSHYADDARSRDRIQLEARAAAGLSHPNIAQVYDYGEADVEGEVIPYVVMELVRGDTLHQRLSDGPVLPRFAMRVCAEVAAALAAAHAEGLAHRDIKPANIMLASTGAKVVDFGIAAAIRPPGPGPDAFEVIGTPAYLAPERLTHDAVESASDVYALGVLLYRLLAGQSPWNTETTTQMLSAIVHLDPDPLLPTSEVPGYVTDLCNRCLAKDPTQRPSARDAAALLARGAGLQVVTDEPTTVLAGTAQPSIDPDPSVLIRPAPAGSGPARRPGRSRRPAYALAALVAALGATWLLWPDDPTVAGSAQSSGAGATAGTPAPGAPPPAGSSAPIGASPGPAGVIPGVVIQVTTAYLTVPGSPGVQLVPPPPASIPGIPGPAPTGTTIAPEPTAPETQTAAPTAGPTVAPTTPTATTTAPPPPPPVQRRLTSAAGSVIATCPSADTAQILSWTAVSPYKVKSGDKNAGPAPAVAFKSGKSIVTMTVTCSDGEPSAS
ncbi:serine/threonine-protein kinase [Micromonosporaceae bacterium Da 78-11]